jgi:hypothetical protein
MDQSEYMEQEVFRAKYVALALAIHCDELSFDFGDEAEF